MTAYAPGSGPSRDIVAPEAVELVTITSPDDARTQETFWVIGLEELDGLDVRVGFFELSWGVLVVAGVRAAVVNAVAVDRGA